MKGQIRREEIVKVLLDATDPISANVLADKFGVSRQIIVKDIAILRQNGENISALSKGYVLEKQKRIERVFKVIHSDEDTEKELNLIVDLGGVVVDVFVYHKAYNKVTATLNIRTRHDVEVFIENVTTGKSTLLKNVTGGYHYHTISADSVEILELIEEKLRENNFLAPLQEYEPDEIHDNKINIKSE